MDLHLLFRKHASEGKHFSVMSQMRMTHSDFLNAIKEYKKSNPVQLQVSPIFTEEEHRILNLLLASKIAEIQVNIVYDEPLDQRMGKVKLMNILNDIHKKVKIRC